MRALVAHRDLTLADEAIAALHREDAHRIRPGRGPVECLPQLRLKVRVGHGDVHTGNIDLPMPSSNKAEATT